MSVHQKKRDGSWYVSWRDGSGKQRAKVFGKGRAAMRAANAYDAEIKARKTIKVPEPVVPTPGTAIYLDQLARKFIEVKKAEGRSKGYLRELAALLNNNFIPEYCQRPAGQLEFAELVGVIANKYAQRSQTTRSRYISYLKILFQFGEDHGYLEKNPLKRWRKPKEQPRKSLLTVEDLNRIYAASTPHLQWAIEVAYHLGVRTGESELLALKWANIDWGQRTIRVYGAKTKSWREIPLSDGFLAKLKEKREQGQTEYIVEYAGKPLRKFRRSFRTACQRAGITYPVVMYDVRHLFATTLLNQGGDLSAVSALLGHSSTQMTANTYYHLQKGEKQRAVALLPKLGGVVEIPCAASSSGEIVSQGC